MEQNNNKIVVTGSPHVRSRMTTQSVMWNVTMSLLPALVCALWVFGWRVIGVVAVSIIGCMLTEYVCNKYLFKRKDTLTDGSAFLTGLLLGMSLPSSLPLPMAFVGGVFAIGVGKMAFGGLGQNIFNPALVGRVFLLISFPAAMTTWPVPMEWDGTTGATILTAMHESGLSPEQIDVMNLALGNRGGSLGEVGTVALLLGGVYLMIRRIIKCYIPLSIIGSIAVLDLVTGNMMVLDLMTGGLILGAVYMATDYVTSPMNRWGQILYGVMIGVITFVIRHYGSYPEGISFAILLMNGCTPLINRWMEPKIFGERRAKA